MSYFIGRGDVYASTRSVTGTPDGFTFLGNCPELVIYPNRAFNRYATGVGAGGALGSLAQSGDLPSFSLQLDEVLKENLGMFLHGLHTTVSGSSATVSITPVVGKFIPLPHINLTSITITGYTVGVHYTPHLPTGGITILPACPPGDISVDYAWGTYNKVGMHTTAQPYYWLRLNGINVGDDSRPVVVDMFKVKLGVPDKLALIGDDFASMTFNGTMYYDDLQPDLEDSGRILQIRSVIT